MSKLRLIVNAAIRVNTFFRREEFMNDVYFLLGASLVLGSEPHRYANGLTWFALLWFLLSAIVVIASKVLPRTTVSNIWILGSTACISLLCVYAMMQLIFRRS
jgi:hypothetical protein